MGGIFGVNVMKVFGLVVLISILLTLGFSDFQELRIFWVGIALCAVLYLLNMIFDYRMSLKEVGGDEVSCSDSDTSRATDSAGESEPEELDEERLKAEKIVLERRLLDLECAQEQYCTSCGSKAGISAKYCGSCGDKITARNESDESIRLRKLIESLEEQLTEPSELLSQKEGGAGVLWIVGLLFLILLGGLLKGGKEKEVSIPDWADLLTVCQRAVENRMHDPSSSDFIWNSSLQNSAIRKGQVVHGFFTQEYYGTNLYGAKVIGTYVCTIQADIDAGTYEITDLSM